MHEMDSFFKMKDHESFCFLSPIPVKAPGHSKRVIEPDYFFSYNYERCYNIINNTICFVFDGYFYLTPFTTRREMILKNYGLEKYEKLPVFFSVEKPVDEPACSKWEELYGKVFE